MKSIKYLLVALTFFVSAVSLASCTQVPQDPSVKNLTVAEFAEQIKSAENAVIIDVRTANEFQSGHIPGAVNIDFYSDDFSQKIEQLDSSKTYYVYCASGNRSGKAASVMATKGMKSIYNMSNGGYSHWRSIK